LKKNLFGKFVVLVCGAMCMTCAGALDSYAIELGDVNNDGIEDASDASEILIAYALLSTGQSTGWTDEQNNCADVNHDGKIDSSDASSVLIYYTYKSTGGISNLEDYYINKELTENVSFDNGNLYSTMAVKESYNASVMQVGLKWNAVEGATGYYVEFYTDQYYDENGQPFKYEKYVTNPQFTAQLPAVLSATNNYRYRIIPYAQYGDFETIWSDKWYADGSLGSYFSNTSSRPYNSVAFRVNTAHLESHDNIAWYDVRNFTTGVNDPSSARRIGSWEQEVDSDVFALTVSDSEKQILDNFASEHFTAGMTNYDKTVALMKWTHDNVVYADGKDGRPSYWDIAGLGYADACINYKAGQCVQYNGIIAEYLAYLGYDVYMLRCYSGDVGKGGGVHFRTEVNIDGIAYSLETGETASDYPPTGYRWEWFFDPNHALLVNRPN